ncbi:predicted protein [Naegleria gruberi]|uniref:Predicted protein n=1 Tax=Naegleria gruberi TaxID=5762 RepID=D2VTD9_NAEGR|nr:uncharacterized protein NAEGRDRAFT_72265 [Naegleria gruberi]EFC39845.1 predicted protein [Naegleria gruberi]|eukprot:XP_002672589.1 predicted protein [Naegleria gruberi strain NEG-M]
MSTISNESSDDLPKFVLYGNRFYRSIGISVDDLDPEGALYTYLFSFEEDDENSHQHNTLESSTTSDPLLNATANSTNANTDVTTLRNDEESEEDDVDEDMSAGGGAELSSHQTPNIIQPPKRDGHEFDMLQSIYQVTGQLLASAEERRVIITYVLWFINLSLKNEESERKKIASSIKRTELEQNLIDIGFKEQSSIYKHVKHIYE